MAATNSLPGQSREQPSRDQLSRDQLLNAEASGTEGSRGGEALVPSPRTLEHIPITLSVSAARLPIELDVAIPVKAFRVRDLLALERGQVIETEWAEGTDMPLSAGPVQLAWSEFEVLEAQLAVRLTRLA